MSATAPDVDDAATPDPEAAPAPLPPTIPPADGAHDPVRSVEALQHLLVWARQRGFLLGGAIQVGSVTVQGLVDLYPRRAETGDKPHRPQHPLQEYMDPEIEAYIVGTP